MAQPMQAVQATAAPEHWKSSLKLPPKDPRYRTEVGAPLIPWCRISLPPTASAWQNLHERTAGAGSIERRRSIGRGCMLLSRM